MSIEKKRERVRLNSREEQNNNKIVLFNTLSYDFENKKFPHWYIEHKYPDYCIDFHFHDYFEIIRIEKGKMKFNTGIGERVLHENDIYIINKNEVHAGYFYDNAYLEYSYLHMDLAILNVLGNSKTQKRIEEIRSGLWGVRAYIPAGTSLNREISECINRVEQTLTRAQKNTQNEFAQLSACFDVLSTFCKLGVFVNPKTNNQRPQKDISAKALSYIQRHYNDKISTKSFCDRYHYDESQFCRLFKRNFGMSFIDFLNSYRIKMACYYKNDEAVNMCEIARQVGFDNYSYFYRQFKKHTGKTPIEYFSAYETGE